MFRTNVPPQIDTSLQVTSGRSVDAKMNLLRVHVSEKTFHVNICDVKL